MAKNWFICQVVCTSIQGISALSGGTSAKVGSCAKYGVLVFKASMFYLQGPSAKVGSSAKLCALVFKGISALSGGSICQSMFICQVLCTGIQGKYHLLELKSVIVIW